MEKYFPFSSEMSVAVFQVAVHLQQVELALVRGQVMSFHPEGNIRQTEDRQPFKSDGEHTS
jgi:hypothetical protein